MKNALLVFLTVGSVFWQRHRAPDLQTPHTPRVAAAGVVGRFPLQGIASAVILFVPGRPEFQGPVENGNNHLVQCPD